MLASLLKQEEYLNGIVAFLEGREMNQLVMLNRGFKESIDDGMWKILCSVAGCKNQNGTTRTRGRRKWRDIYRDNLCGECESFRGNGVAIFDLAGGSMVKNGRSGLSRAGLIGFHGSKVALCSTCLAEVATKTSWGSRRSLLPRLRRKDESMCMLLMQKIPLGDIRKVKKETISKRARAEGAVESCSFNDYLLKQVV